MGQQVKMIKASLKTPLCLSGASQSAQPPTRGAAQLQPSIGQIRGEEEEMLFSEGRPEKEQLFTEETSRGVC